MGQLQDPGVDERSGTTGTQLATSPATSEFQNTQENTPASKGRRLRVLQVTECSMGGVGRHVIELSAGLVDRGCDVHLIYSDKRMSNFFKQRLAACPGLKSCMIPMRREPHPADFVAGRQIRKYIRQHGPFDIVHGHSSKGGALARLVAGRPARRFYTPNAIYTMNPLQSSLSYFVFKTAEQILSIWTDDLIAVSHDEVDHFKEVGIAGKDGNKLHWIPNGISPQPLVERTEARRILGLPQEGMIIGFVGNLWPQKDPLLILRSFGILAKKRSDVYLVMAGEGAIEADLRKLTQELGLQDRVFLLGFRPGAQVMGASDLFVLASYYEGLAYVLMEALASSLPIVSTRALTGASDLIDEGVNGYIVNKRDPVEFAAKMEEALSDPVRLKEFAKASGEKSKAFTVDRMVDLTLETYLKSSHVTIN